MDSVGYDGPVAFGSDCTKVRQRLTYSTDFGSHILGSVLSMEECEVHENEDVETVMKRINADKDDKKATQVRAIMVNVTHSKFVRLAKL